MFKYLLWGCWLAKSDEFLARLLNSGYLPEELPPTVTSRDFSAFCKRHMKSLLSQRDQLIKLSTNYDTYSAPRNKSGRRELAVVHPLAQLVISLLITEKRREIKTLIIRSGTSLYDTADGSKSDRAFSGLDFVRRRKLASKLHSKHPFILEADISRFFYTAYTHSIHGRLSEKKKLRNCCEQIERSSIAIGRISLTKRFSHVSPVKRSASL